MDAFFVTANLILLAYSFAVTGFFVSRRSQNRSVRAFAYVCAGACIWALGQFLLALISVGWPNETAFFWANKLTYLGMTVLPPAVVHVSWVYCGQYALYTNKKLVYGMIALSALFFLIILTDPLHHLYYHSFALSGRSYTFFWYAFTLYAYACFTLGCVWMVVHHRKRRPDFIKYYLLLYLPSVLSNTLGIFIRDYRFDLTSLSVALMLTSALLLVFRKRTVNISPIAAEKILTEVGYPVYILSPEDDILFENAAALNNPGVMAAYIQNNRETVTPEGGRVYKAKRTKLPDGNTLLAFLDITRYIKMLSGLESQNAELMRLQAELEAQMETARAYAEVALEYAARRSRQEVMTKLGGEVYVIINRLLENTRAALTREIPDAETIQRNIALAQEGVKTVRAIIDEIKGERWDEF
ncbi:hypothetical protein FACS1894191_1170 [Clostridia bacterium]|nr:hypothetical protein FACS1894191_1170 [Clostridia bacterium]